MHALRSHSGTAHHSTYPNSKRLVQWIETWAPRRLLAVRSHGHSDCASLKRQPVQAELGVLQRLVWCKDPSHADAPNSRPATYAYTNNKQDGAKADGDHDESLARGNPTHIPRDTPIPSRSKKIKVRSRTDDFYNLCTSLTLLSLPTTNLSCLPLASSASRNTPSLNGSV